MQPDDFYARVREVTAQGKARLRELLRLRRTHWAYSTTFLSDRAEPSPHAAVVLADIARFCRADETCFDADPRTHALLEGRREVWLRIQAALKLDRAAIERLIKLNQEDVETDDE
ncbi:Bbp19 family protein [Sphingomonas sp. KC8]|uniref:Bbp19 family protein n=1 Tax=Sphingomonas sp. KC8 TaxID=1030157 RepID=UPI000248A430|nr:hypothetical protein [Sphingomonas sp. KC8]ARS27619.1 hypothetical protein KC8_09975 [Sphingomonas sp. KC8]